MTTNTEPDAAAAPPSDVLTPPPAQVPRRFHVQRDEGVTGLSGTGVVADGCTFPGGTTVVRWRELPTDSPNYVRGVRATTVVFPNPEAVEVLHGHGGATRLLWLDTARVAESGSPAAPGATESADRPAPCEMAHTPPFDFASCLTHDTTFPLGSKCEWDGVESILDHLDGLAQEQRGRAVRAEMRLAAALAERDAARTTAALAVEEEARLRERIAADREHDHDECRGDPSSPVHVSQSGRSPMSARDNETPTPDIRPGDVVRLLGGRAPWIVRRVVHPAGGARSYAVLAGAHPRDTRFDLAGLYLIYPSGGVDE